MEVLAPMLLRRLLLLRHCGHQLQRFLVCKQIQVVLTLRAQLEKVSSWNRYSNSIPAGATPSPASSYRSTESWLVLT